MSPHDVLIAGAWRVADSSGEFQAENPATKTVLDGAYPVSRWSDCDAALCSAVEAWEAMRGMPRDSIARFLEVFADRIDGRKDELSSMANLETALPVAPRLADIELPRTSGQLRSAAAACREGSWALTTIDTTLGIRSHYGSIGPVCVFGPNNFPFAFGSLSGGDFAAAIAAGNPVVGKANSSHPGTTRLFAEEAKAAAEATGMPSGIVQLLYRTSHADGERLVADPRVGATAYTGSRSAGLKLKAAADQAGKPIYLELSSINPVVILPGVLEERGEELAAEFAGSCLMGTGQFCTNPGLVVLIAGDKSDQFVDSVVAKFNQGPVGTLLSKGVANSLTNAIQSLCDSGAERLTDEVGVGNGYSQANTLLRVSGESYLENPGQFQEEAFGNESLVVVASDVEQAGQIISKLEGNLTGCIYSANDGRDDNAYDQIAPLLRTKVGRLLNDKMPTGVAVASSMNHGGPYPATGHPGFTAVGIPGSLLRFGALHCYDNVRPQRLPVELQDANPTGETWRLIDGKWSTADL